jgi:hypothetical protein
MPFEYGIARALDKETVVIHSERLPKSIWGRIEAGVGNPEYSDLRFAETVKLVAEHCRHNFRNK